MPRSTSSLNSNWRVPPKSDGFPYPPLNKTAKEFRLLRVFPRQLYQQIACELFTSSPDRHAIAPFHALSYHWTRSNQPGQILINGHNFPVEGSLAEFLVAFTRRIKQPETLWIDAICIDQASVEERNHQVSLMTDIYTRASSVYVWLGKLVPSDTEVRWFLDEMETSLARGRVRDLGKLTFHEYIRRAVEAHNQLTRRPYFSRTWILQEVLLAHRVELLIAEHSFFWDSWSAFVWMLQEHSKMAIESYSDLRSYEQFPPSVWSTLDKRRRERKQGSGGLITDLADLTADFEEQECSLRHDRIYALLSLTSPPTRILIAYEESMLHVFLRAYWTLRGVEHLAIMALARRLGLEDELFDPCTHCDRVKLRVSFIQQPYQATKNLGHSDGRFARFLLAAGAPFIYHHAGRQQLLLCSSSGERRDVRSAYTLTSATFDRVSGGVAIAVTESNNGPRAVELCAYFPELRKQTHGISWTATRICLQYCVVASAIQDTRFKWQFAEPVGNSKLHHATLSAPLKPMLRFLFVIRRIGTLNGMASLNGARSYCQAVQELHLEGLIGVEHLGTCLRHAKRFDKALGSESPPDTRFQFDKALILC